MKLGFFLRIHKPLCFGTTTPPTQAAGLSASPAQTAQNQLAYQQMHQQQKQQQQLQQQQPNKTCVIKVNIHSDECKNKIKKILQKIEGVYNVEIDSDQGMVTVSGDFDLVSLVKKLTEKGKRQVEIITLTSCKHHLNNQFKNLQIDNGKGGNNNNEGQGGQKGDVGNQPKGGGDPQGQNRPNLNLQQMKGMQDPKMVPQFMKDMKMPIGGNNNKGAQNPKAVKFNLPEDEGFSNDEFGDDDNYDDDDKFNYDLCDAPLNKMKSMMGNEHGGGSGSGGGGPPQMMPNMIMKGGGNSGDNGGNAKKGGGMNDGPHGVPNMMFMNGRVPIGNIGNPEECHMFSLAAVQGLLVSMNRGDGGLGYIEGGGPEPMARSPYLQELANAMMNQQRANGNVRFQPMMYARPPPDVNYMPPYSHYPYLPPPGYWADQY